MPLVVACECRLAAHLHMDTVRVRRAPLPLVLLWLNHAAQADGMETWWLEECEQTRGAEAMAAELAALREAAAEDCTFWGE